MQAMKDKRLVWSELPQGRTPNQRMDVMLSDERKLDIMMFKSALVRRGHRSDRYQPGITINNVKHPASVMVWGYFSRCDGRSSLDFLVKGVTMKAVNYLDIIEWKLVPKFRAKRCSCYQQDLAPCHITKICKQVFEQARVPLLAWPENSPDLNPIENDWNWMKDILQQRFYTNIDELKKEPIRVWTTIMTPKYCRTLAESMPRRIWAVQAAGGHQTKY